MATTGWRSTDSVADRLFNQTQAFEFGQALSLLRLLHPAATPPGHGVDPRQETVRLTGALAPVFSPSALGQLQRPGKGETQPQLQVNLFGLGGPDGPLPYAWQEWLQARRMRKDHAPAAFLDLFHQRLLGQLYRAQEKYRVAAPFAAPFQSQVFPIMRALVGLLPRPLHDRQEIPDAALLARSAILANRRRSASGFQSLVQGQFGVPIRIGQFDGGWSDLPESALTRLGRKARNNRLGQGTLAGNRMWDEQAGIRVTLGSLSLPLYQAFLPGGTRHAEFMALAAFYFGTDMRVRLVLQLHADQLPSPTLGKSSAMKLGWTSWLSAKHNTRARQCVIAPGVDTLS